MFRFPKLRLMPSYLSIFIASVSLLIAACDPAATHLLSDWEKKADMMWLFSIFKNNYAPLELKEEEFNTKFEKLMTEYLAKASKAKTNAEFYRVQHEFVAEFADAHTGGRISPANFPGQAEVAFLGISGERDGDTLRVTGLMPTIDSETFPIKEGDKIVAIDGVKLPDYIKRNLVKYRNLGDDSANVTMHLNNIFTRMSLSLPMPEKADVTLTIDRGEKKPVKVTLPWIVRDLYDFRLDQALQEAKKNNSDKLQVRDPKSGNKLEFVLLDERGRPINVSRYLEKLALGKTSPLDGFKMSSISSIAIKKAAEDAEEPPTGWKKFAKERKIPENAIPVSTTDGTEAYPAYMYSIDVTDKNGTKRGTKRIGVIRVEDFEPAAGDDEASKELVKTLKKFKANGVNSIVLDMIDNPGGSLRLALLFSQHFSSKKIIVPDMQVMLNDTWMGEFKTIAQTRTNPPHLREAARRIYEQLVADKQAGKRISAPISMESIMPFELAQTEGVDFDRVVTLVTEFNASCGDIVPAILQDNGISIIAGKKTMGAGGNVVDFMFEQAPNGHYGIRQTESLVVRRDKTGKNDGKYIENKGVTPEIDMDINAGLEGKYASTMKEVEKTILLPKDPVGSYLANKEKNKEDSVLAKACSNVFGLAEL